MEFADDLSLVAQAAAQLQKKLNRLAEESCAVGLEINVAKTKIMCSLAATDTIFRIVDETIETVSMLEWKSAFRSLKVDCRWLEKHDFKAVHVSMTES